ncbi:MAG: hypothetical protein ACLFS1_02315 [Opitutales bacterium]
MFDPQSVRARRTRYFDESAELIAPDIGTAIGFKACDKRLVTSPSVHEIIEEITSGQCCRITEIRSCFVSASYSTKNVIPPGSLESSVKETVLPTGQPIATSIGHIVQISVKRTPQIIHLASGLSGGIEKMGVRHFYQSAIRIKLR